MASPTAEHSRTDPASYGSARSLTSRYGPDFGNAEPSERSPGREEGTEHGDGAAAADTLSRTG